MSARVIISHGTKGSPKGNWFPWLRNELRSRGVNALAPAYPTPEGQSLSNWLDTFANTAGAVESSDILVGHSIGAAFSLRVVERAKGPVGGLVLAAGFAALKLGLPEYDALNRSFLEEPFDWASIRAKASDIRIYHGDDDPYVPVQLSRELAKALEVEPVIISGGKHLNAESGWLQFPPLLKDVLALAVSFD